MTQDYKIKQISQSCALFSRGRIGLVILEGFDRRLVFRLLEGCRVPVGGPSRRRSDDHDPSARAGARQMTNEHSCRGPVRPSAGGRSLQFGRTSAPQPWRGQFHDVFDGG